MMQYTELGRSRMRVSRVCLGCMGFGDPSAGQHSWTIQEGSAREVVRNALDAGINFFDTAPVYQGGTSERYLGDALRELADRDDVVVATKFVPRSPDEIASGVSGRDHVLRSLEGSLERLGMDHVDLFICHMWDYGTPLPEIMLGLKEAMDSGKVSHIGISNCFAWQLCMANSLADAMDMERFVSVQNHHNLIFREEEREMLPFCRTMGIATTPYSPLASGRLSRPRGAGTTKRLAEDSYARFKYDSTEQQDSLIEDRVAELAERHGVPMTQVSLAWLLTKATSPVVGATRPEQVADIAESTELRLTADEAAWLEEPYVPHRLVGVMAQNTPETAGERKVWTSRNRRPLPAAGPQDRLLSPQSSRRPSCRTARGRSQAGTQRRRRGTRSLCSRRRRLCTDPGTRWSRSEIDGRQYIVSLTGDAKALYDGYYQDEMLSMERLRRKYSEEQIDLFVEMLECFSTPDGDVDRPRSG